MNTKKDKVLVVDDEPNNLHLMMHILDGLYQLTFATDGYKALELAEKLQPDLILLDVMMPGMDGYEVCKKLKSDEATRDILVVFVTAKSNHDDEIRGLGLGAIDYITKPVSPAIVKARIKNHLELQRCRNRIEKQNQELKIAKELAEDANQKINDSIRYARLIQDSLLPTPHDMKKYIHDGFIIWMPRDIVSGDLYFSDSFGDGFVCAVIDCTGHGIPGAFMTMIASSFFKKIVKDEGCRDPAEILRHLNSGVKTLLRQDTEYALSDDGLEGAVCFVKPGEKKLIFAGARSPLFYVKNSEVHVIKGDRQSVGYKRSDLNFTFTAHTVSIEENMSFYMASDGYWGQIGGQKQIAFGKNRFTELLKEISQYPFKIQREKIIQEFEDYRGENDIQDDVTVAGFSV